MIEYTFYIYVQPLFSSADNFGMVHQPQNNHVETDNLCATGGHSGSARVRISTDTHTPDHRWLIAFVACLGVWLVMRILFFVGLTGSDDLYYARFSALWDRAPANHWEARLIGNTLTSLSMKIFGQSVWAMCAPSCLASLAIMSSAFYTGLRMGGILAALYAGMFIAVLPLDVDMATTISPHTIMVAIMTVGTALMITRPQGRWISLLTGGLFALGVITHFAGTYYVGAILIAAWIIDRQQYAGIIRATLLLVVVFLLLDASFFYFAYGDFYRRFQVCTSEMTDLPMLPWSADGSWNTAFFTWPIRQLIYSKAFGISLFVMMGTGLWQYRRLNQTIRLLLISMILLWLWMGFGSKVPWAYEPFWRMNRFLHPMAFSLAIFFAILSISNRRKLLTVTISTLIWSVCLMNLLSSGTWNQGTRISHELLTYANAHPSHQFITDYHTLNEMYILNHVQPIPNVVTTNEFLHSRLLDRSAKQIRLNDAHAIDALLYNPLNASRSTYFAGMMEQFAGTLQHETRASYRTICLLWPKLRESPWALIKPPAQVFRCIDPEKVRVAHQEHRE